MSKRNDISQQIRKYLNGELDARAMHQLEKEAQNDPFLMEALEGYEQLGKDQQKSLADVDLRLHDRISKKERRIIPFRIIAIAASVLIALTIGGLWLREQSVVKVEKTMVKLANPQKPVPVSKPTKIDTLKSIIQASPVINRIAKNKPHKIKRKQPVLAANAEVKAPPPVTMLAAEVSPQNKKDTIGLDEVAVRGYATQKKTMITGNATAKTLDYSANNIAPQSNALNGKVAGLYITPGNNKPITGVVKDETGQPIPGVMVKIKGTNVGTQTNSAGKFTLTAVPKGATLILAFVGYNSQQIAVNRRDSLVIAMQPNTNSLAEVVVTGYGTKKPDEDQQYEAAQPINGWDNFKKYLKDNAVSPDGKAGVVKVSFIVDQNGYLSGFKIRKSVSIATDNAAIRLIENGPLWKTNSDHKPEVVKVRVKFTKPE